MIVVAVWLARVQDRKQGAWEQGDEANTSASVAFQVGPCTSFRSKVRLTGKGFRFVRSVKSVNSPQDKYQYDFWQT